MRSWLVRRRSSVREEYLVEIKCKRKIQKNLQKFGENGEQQARKHLQAYRKRDGSKRLQIWKKFSTTSSAKEASSERAASSRKNMTRSGFGLTRPAWALAYGLPRAPTTSPRDKAPRWREGSSKQTAARGSTDLGSGDPPATTQTASVDPEGPVPSGALSITSERPIRRALGRKAASARITSKKVKIWVGKMQTALGGPLRL